MAFGLGILRLSPDAFWALTPIELAAAMRGVAGRAAPTPPGRERLAELMQIFPD